MSMFSVGRSAGASAGPAPSPPRAPVGASYLVPISGHVRTRRTASEGRGEHEERRDEGERQYHAGRGRVVVR